MIVKGETVILTARFTDKDGEPVYPMLPVTVTVCLPDGTRTIDRENADSMSAGVYEFTYITTISGEHHYKFESGDGGVEQASFNVISDKTE